MSETQNERDRKRYESVFLDTYGLGPYQCYFCTETVSRVADRRTDAGLDIHHLDHDKTNDVSDNLVPAHHGCHLTYHLKCQWSLGERQLPENFTHRTPHTDETKKKISEAKRGKKQDPEVTERIASANRGKTRSDEFKEAASERAKSRTAEHREKLAAANLGKKRSEEAKEKMRQSALMRHARERAAREGGDAT